jgi:uncharacterized protein
MNDLLDFFCPDQWVRGVVDVDIAALKAEGYQSILLDLDNTLLPWQSTVLPESSKAWILQAKELGMKLCIVSNTHNPKRLYNIAADLDIRALAHALKPRPAGFEKAAGMLGCAPERSVVVGDQVLTDILGGNLACMYTVLVRPMHPREFIGTKVSRLFERWILSLLRKRGKLAGCTLRS